MKRSILLGVTVAAALGSGVVWAGVKGHEDPAMQGRLAAQGAAASTASLDRGNAGQGQAPEETSGIGSDCNTNYR
jgi:hypothetical protein